jgi:alanyl aminopeptidase
MSYTIDGQPNRQCTLLKEERVDLDLEAEGCPVYVMPNADGGGYYRFALDEDGWLALMQNLSEFSEREALATADSLTAAYEADRVSTETLMNAYRQVAQSPYRAVTMMPSAKLKRIRDCIHAFALSTPASSHGYPSQPR